MQHLRLFIALELPDDIQRFLTTSFRRLPLHHEVYRQTVKEQLHVTMKFLGDKQLEDLPLFVDVVEQFEGYPAASVELLKARLIPQNRPRTVIVDIAPTKNLVDLQKAIDQALIDAELAQPERRGFRPHVTVARLTAPVPEGDGDVLSRWSLDHEVSTAYTLTLFQSELKPGGAVYTPLTQIVLT